MPRPEDMYTRHHGGCAEQDPFKGTKHNCPPRGATNIPVAEIQMA